VKLVYIAGPFTSRPGVPHEQNIRFVEELARALAGTYPEVQPVVPHSLGRVLYGYQDEEAAYEGTLALLRRCDAVVLQEAWEESRGAQAEREEALRLGLPIFEEHELFAACAETPRFAAWLTASSQKIEDPQAPPVGVTGRSGRPAPEYDTGTPLLTPEPAMDPQHPQVPEARR
jgi:hypothetical protein